MNDSIFIITMENCNQTVTMQLHCSCHENNRTALERESQGVDLRPLYQKFGQTLESELQKLSDGYIAQIDDLNSQIFTLKNTVQRLQIRNRKDGEAERELRREYNILLQKLREREKGGRPVPEVQVVERVKEVRVEVMDNSLPLQVARWRQKYEEANQLYLKTRGEKEAVEVENGNLAEQIQQLRVTIQGLRRQTETGRRREGVKQQQLQKLQNQVDYLKTNKEVIVQTKHFFPDFKPSQKVRPQTKIETVYIEKPVEKVVVVEVERRVKEFIQPERPLVNRIISCQPRGDCRCKQTDFLEERRSGQIEHLNEVVMRLEGNVKEYKNQRERLVHVIEDKNRELNSLETQIRLFGRGESYHRGPSTINVTVTKLEDEIPISQKVSRGEAEQSRATQGRRR